MAFVEWVANLRLEDTMTLSNPSSGTPDSPVSWCLPISLNVILW